jgi:hypothetical protein
VEGWGEGVVDTRFRVRIVAGDGVATVVTVLPVLDRTEWTEKEMKPSCLGADEDEEGYVAMRMGNGIATPVRVGESGGCAVDVARTV